MEIVYRVGELKQANSALEIFHMYFMTAKKYSIFNFENKNVTDIVEMTNCISFLR